MKRLKSWAPALIWMGVIFAMSAVPGETSGEQSGMIVRLVQRAAARLLGQEAAAGLSLDMIHLLVRKGAHMAEYAVLFGCYHHALRSEEAKRPGLTALLLCIFYAATDEWHQNFTENRGPSAVDVGIDALGAAFGWMMSSIKQKMASGKRA